MDDDPILFLPATFARHEEAVQAVQDEIRTRAPRPGGQRFPGSSPGAWGLLAIGDSITAASGTTLGTGTVKLCDSSGTPIDPETTVSVKNAGAEIPAGAAARVVALEWTWGDWSACGCKPGDETPPCQLCVTVLDQCSPFLPVSGATVTVTKAGFATVTCTTDAAGKCCVDIPSSGTYNVAVSKAGFAGSNKPAVVTCPGTTDVTLTLVVDAKKSRICVTGCPIPGGGFFPLPGVTVNVGSSTYTTGSDGCVSFSAPTGTYSVTVSKPRFVSQTFSFTVTCLGGSANRGLSPATGFHCCGCADPLPDNLMLTTNLYGAVGIAWNAVSGYWEAFQAISFPGYCKCPARPSTIHWRFCFNGNLHYRYWFSNTNNAFGNNCPVLDGDVDENGFSPFGEVACGVAGGGGSFVSCIPTYWTGSWSRQACSPTLGNSQSSIWQGVTVVATVTE